MKKTIYFLLFFLPVIVIAQEKAKTANDIKGTYQFEFLSSSVPPVSITSELVEKIEKLRKEKETTYLEINTQCRVKILSRNDLLSIDKTKLEEYVIVKKFTNQ